MRALLLLTLISGMHIVYGQEPPEVATDTPFVDEFAVPGIVTVTLAESRDRTDRMNKLFRAYGLTPLSAPKGGQLAEGATVPDQSYGLATPIYNYFNGKLQPIGSKIEIYVDPGYENAWVAILGGSHIFSHVERPRINFVSVDKTLPFPKQSKKAQRPTTNRKVETTADSLVEAFLQAAHAHYRQKGEFVVRRKEPSQLKFEVSAMRREVIRSENFWESITMHLIQIAGQPNTVVLILDGEYAPGVGGSRPPQRAYANMDGLYYRDMVSYLEAVATSLMHEIESNR